MALQKSLFHIHQYGPHRPAKEVVATEGIIELAGHKRHPIILLGLEGRVYIFDGDEFRLAHFVDVGQAPRVDFNLVAVFQAFDLGESTGLVKGIPDMTGDNGIPRPSWESGSS